MLPDPDLRQRIQALVWVRFAVAPAIILGAVFAAYAVGISELNVGALCLLAAALFLCNMLTYTALMHGGFTGKANSGHEKPLEWVLHFSVATDFVLLAIAVWLVGGPFSPFMAFFVFNVIVASMLLSRRAAFCHATFALALLTVLVIGTWRGWVTGHYPEGAVAAPPVPGGAYVTTVLAVHGLLIMLTALLTTHLMRALRGSARRLARSNQELETVSQLRRDFLQIALHNLRSPVGVVSMHLSNLAHGYGGPLSEEQREWIARSQHRLQDLTHFLNDLEYLAALETGDLKPHFVRMDLRDILRESVEEFRELAESFGHTLSAEPGADPAPVEAVPRLVREALANFVSNAAKYTPRGGRIALRIVGGRDTATIEVEDNGIGVAAEDRKRLFREMVRIRPEHPKMENVPGSGLGLHIVQRIAELHGAAAGVRGNDGAGSTFTLTFPKADAVAENP